MIMVVFAHGQAFSERHSNQTNKLHLQQTDISTLNTLMAIAQEEPTFSSTHFPGGGRTLNVIIGFA